MSSSTVRRPRAPVLWRMACSAHASRASSREDQLDVIEGEEALELLDERVLGLREDAYQLFFAERGEADHHRQAADELGDEAVVKQVVMGVVLEQLVGQVLAGLLL